jgi:hypothetical protein
MLLTINTLRLRKGLDDVAHQQLPFAVALAINRTLEEGQAGFRKTLPQHFTLRRKQFIERLVKIENRDRATKASPYGRMGIQGNRADILTKFEEGGVRRPRGHSLYVPIDVKRNKRDLVTNANKPKAFSFVRERTNSNTGIAVFQGNKRTFMVRFPDGRGWLFKRTKRGKHGELFTGTKVLYALIPKAPIPKALHFEETVVPILQARFPVNLQGMLAAAIRTAK